MSTPVSRSHRLPHVLVATAFVVIAPTTLAFLLTRLLGGGRPGLVLPLLSFALSVATGGLVASIWARVRPANDLYFRELMLWNWMRLARADRRAAQNTALLTVDTRVVGAPTDAAEKRRLLTELNAALEIKDPYTLGHSRRVARLAYWTAMTMKLPLDDVNAVRTAAQLHDVGKVYVPDSILRKPAALTDTERIVMQEHPGAGAELVSRLRETKVTEMVRYHHERWDGGGYPTGIQGPEIPLGARIIAVADAYDAMTTTRAYRRKSSAGEAVHILRCEAGAQFDPGVVSAFLAQRTQRSFAWTALLALGGWPERVVDLVRDWLRSSLPGDLVKGAAAAMSATVVTASLFVPVVARSQTNPEASDRVLLVHQQDDSSDEQATESLPTSTYSGTLKAKEAPTAKNSAGQKAAQNGVGKKGGRNGLGAGSEAAASASQSGSGDASNSGGGSDSNGGSDPSGGDGTPDDGGGDNGGGEGKGDDGDGGGRGDGDSGSGSGESPGGDGDDSGDGGGSGGDRGGSGGGDGGDGDDDDGDDGDDGDGGGGSDDGDDDDGDDGGGGGGDEDDDGGSDDDDGGDDGD